MSRSERLNTTVTGLADLVRLWAQALQHGAPCDQPRSEWCHLLRRPGFDASQTITLYLPSQLNTPDSKSCPDVVLLSPEPQPPEPISASELPLPAQRPCLQAPVLAVVAADFEPVLEQTEEVQRHEALPDLQLEDYEPLEPAAQPPWLPLAPTTRWWPALRDFSPLVVAGPDLQRLVRDYAHRQPPRRLPRFLRRGRYRRLLLLWDCRKCMIPYWQDFHLLLQRLKVQKQAVVLQVIGFHGLPPTVPVNVDAVLLMSDLGLCATSDFKSTVANWIAWACALANRGVAMQAWMPVSAQRIPAALARVLPCIPWHECGRFRPSKGHPSVSFSCVQQRAAWMDHVLPLLAIAQRIEPALLRRARLLAGGQGQPEWESTLWESSDQHIAGEEVMQIYPRHAPVWRKKMGELSIGMQKQVWHMFCAQHAYLPRSTLFIEQLIWSAYVDLQAHDSACHEAVEHAKDWLTRMSMQEMRHRKANLGSLNEDLSLHSGFLLGLVQRMNGDKKFTEIYAEIYAPLALAVGRAGSGVGVPDSAWVSAIQSIQMVRDWQEFSIQLHYLHEGAFIECRFDADTQTVPPSRQRSLLLPKARRYGEIWKPKSEVPRSLQMQQLAVPGTLSFRDAEGRHTIELDFLRREAWQHALGQDRYGLFCEVLVKAMVLRFRYIPPGTYLQGSPDKVEHPDEYPQHPVTITKGFWLADTPCTQELWLVIMGSNPSHFRYGADALNRPVENVSWEDTQIFLKKLQSLLPFDAECVLPTESQWEYACRAGTKN